MKQRRRGPALTKAELRAQGNQAMAAATRPIVKLPTKLVRQCGRCGEPSSVMRAGARRQAPPPFKCKSSRQARSRRQSYHRVRGHAAGQSGRIGPDTPSNAPSTSSQTRSRAGSTGPGMVARPLGMRLKPDLAVVGLIADQHDQPVALGLGLGERALDQRVADPTFAERRLDGERPEQQRRASRRCGPATAAPSPPAACRCAP